jgi:hypothetical protein
MKYHEALKAYYGKLGKKVEFPKKGSAEHAAICALMASGDIAAGSGVSAEAALMTGEVKVKKPRGKKAAPPPKETDIKPATADGPAKTKLIDVPHLTEKVEKKIEDAPEKPPVKKRKPRAVKADGLSPQQQLLKSDTELNSGIKITPAAYPDLKEQISKVLAVEPEGIPKSKEKIDKPVIQRSATQRKNKSPDMPAITERAPFSFSSIRQLLRQ